MTVNLSLSLSVLYFIIYTGESWTCFWTCCRRKHIPGSHVMFLQSCFLLCSNGSTKKCVSVSQRDHKRWVLDTAGPIRRSGHHEESSRDPVILARAPVPWPTFSIAPAQRRSLRLSCRSPTTSYWSLLIISDPMLRFLPSRSAPPPPVSPRQDEEKLWMEDVSPASSGGQKLKVLKYSILYAKSNADIKLFETKKKAIAMKFKFTSRPKTCWLTCKFTFFPHLVIFSVSRDFLLWFVMINCRQTKIFLAI